MNPPQNSRMAVVAAMWLFYYGFGTAVCQENDLSGNRKDFVAQSGSAVATILFYNVENLFDYVDDPNTNDNEFLPEGERRWNSFRFYAKINNLSKVINNTGLWEPPAIIGLCEVENRYVLEKLVNHPALRKWDYRIIHKDSPDERGIDVAAIYRPDLFHPLTYRYFPPSGQKTVSATREILCVSGIVAGVDTVHLFFNHWPSRFGGLLETRGLRQAAAARLKGEVRELQRKYLYPRIIAMGDFNDQPLDDSMVKFLGAATTVTGHPDSLVNLSHQWLAMGKGTLKYQSEWNIFDQIIVSESLLAGAGKLFARPSDATIVEPDFLFEPDERHGGRKLRRTYEGFQYRGGFSDHLPVLLVLRLN